MVDSQLKIILALKDEATAKLQSFNKTMGEFQKQTSSGFDTAKKGLTAIRKPALIATAALTAVAVAGFKLAESAGEYESIRDAFSTMTEDMGVGVEEFEKKVADASAGTLDKLTILRGGTRALSLMGKEAFSDFGSQFAQMAELSKKAARATGMEVTYMFDSLITGMSRESKMILDNLGITVDLVKAKEEYAVTLGKEVSELTIAEEKTAVLNHTLEKLEAIYGEVAVSSGGMSGAMSQLKTTITDAKLEIGLALIPVFNELVRAITPLIKEYVPKLIEGLKVLVEWFTQLSPIGKKMLLLFLALAPAIVIVTSVLIPLITVIQGLIPIVQALAIAFGVGVGSLVATFGLVVLAIASVGTAIYLLIRGWDDVKWALGLLKQYFIDTWDGIKIIVRETIDSIMSKIQPLLDIIGKVKTGVSDLKEKIPEIKIPTFSIPSWLQFQEGGTVPGRIGEPIPAIVHGGETVIPAGENAGNVFNFNFEGEVSDRDALIKLIVNAINRAAELKAVAGE